MNSRYKHLAAQAAFVILVILVPVAFGVGWSEHQRTDDIASLVERVRQASVASCERGNTIRQEHNRLVHRYGEAVLIIRDYLRLDAAAERAGLSKPELQAVARLARELRDNADAPILPIVDCEATVR